MSARDFKAATDLVAQPIPLDTMNIIERPSDKRRANRIGRGYGEAGDPMFTITKGHSHAVAQPIGFNSKDYGSDATTDMSPTLRSLGAYGANGGGNMAVMRESGQGYWMKDDVSGTLRAEGENRPSRPSHVINQSNMAVRRLTPRECERLQGFPDDYTNIPKAADGPRYKALGNSMAVPVMAWIGKRIQTQLLLI